MYCDKKYIVLFMIKCFETSLIDLYKNQNHKHNNITYIFTHGGMRYKTMFQPTGQRKIHDH